MLTSPFWKRPVTLELLLGSSEPRPEVRMNLVVSFGALVILAVLALAIIGRGRKNGYFGQSPQKYFQNSVWFTLFSPVIMVWWLFKVQKDGLSFVDELIAKRGSIFEVVRNIYVISDPKAIQKILSSNDPRHLNKTKLAEVAFRLGGIKDGLIGAEPVIWAPHRKLVSPCFSYKSLQTYLITINKQARMLVESLKNGDSSTSSTNNLLEIIDLHMTKIISSIVMGADVVTDEENKLFRKNFQRAKKLCMYRTYRPWLHSDFTWKLHPYRKELEESRGQAHGFVYKLIETYKANLKKPTDIKTEDEDSEIGVRPHRSMIEVMLESGMSEKEILTEVLTFLIAGHESTTTQISLLMFHLASNPKEQEKCQQEIDESSEGFPDGMSLTMDDLGNLKHLERCVLESLRLTPVFPIIMRRLDTKLRIDDLTEIKGNSDVLIPVWTLHRDPRIHENPLDFNPDRFISMKGNSNSSGFLPFSSGPRNCIGWKLAMMEIKVVVASILKFYHVETDQKLEEVKFFFDGALKPGNEIHLRLRHRNQSSSN